MCVWGWGGCILAFARARACVCVCVLCVCVCVWAGGRAGGRVLVWVVLIASRESGLCSSPGHADGHADIP